MDGSLHELPFAAALRDAIGSRGLGLDQVRQLLALRGSDVSVATLSYWQTGRRSPGRRTSFVTLAHLEDALGMTPGSLAQHIPPRGTEARAVNSVLTFAAAMGEGVELPEVIAGLDARLRRQFEMVSEQAVLSVGAQRGQEWRWTRRIMRAVADGVDRLLLADLVEDDVPPPSITPVLHCTLGRRVFLPTSKFVISELLFDRVLGAGDPMLIEYRLDYGPPYPLDTTHEVHKQMPLRDFVLEVRFDADARPTRCEWFEHNGHDPQARARVRRVTLDEAGTVLVVRQDLPPGRFGLRWDWEAERVGELVERGDRLIIPASGHPITDDDVRSLRDADQR